MQSKEVVQPQVPASAGKGNGEVSAIPIAHESDQDRASSIACSASTLPAKGDLRCYRSFDYLPNYWTIESAEYTDNGFSLSGYIHADDAARMARAWNDLQGLRAALHEMLIFHYGTPADMRDQRERWNGLSATEMANQIEHEARAALSSAEGE